MSRRCCEYAYVLPTTARGEKYAAADGNPAISDARQMWRLSGEGKVLFFGSSQIAGEG
jgi:hypothetical protein